jgi:uncharacterized membrane protein
MSMNTQRDSFHLALALAAVGAGLCLVTATVPFYHTSYTLRVGVLLTGLLPYLVYVVGAWLERGRLSIILGLVLLAVDLYIKLPARFVTGDVTSDRLIYAAPLLEAAVLVIVFWVTTRQGPRREEGPAG